MKVVFVEYLYCLMTFRPRKCFDIITMDTVFIQMRISYLFFENKAISSLNLNKETKDVIYMLVSFSRDAKVNTTINYPAYLFILNGIFKNYRFTYYFQYFLKLVVLWHGFQNI